MSVIDVPVTPRGSAWPARDERQRQTAAFAEAAMSSAVLTPSADPEFDAALRIVAHSVKHLLSPSALAYLEGTLDDDARAGAMRWRELARLYLWLSKARLPVGSNARKLVKRPGYTRTMESARLHAKAHPHKLLRFKALAMPGRTVAAIYGIARRAKVPAGTVATALINFGLERLTHSLRETGAVPPTLTDEQAALFPEAT